MHILMLSLVCCASDVTIGFEKEVYAVHENANTVSVCAVVLEGELERDVEMNVTIQSNNIAGWLNVIIQSESMYAL